MLAIHEDRNCSALQGEFVIAGKIEGRREVQSTQKPGFDLVYTSIFNLEKDSSILSQLLRKPRLGPGHQTPTQ